MPEFVYKVTGGNKRLDTKSYIFEDYMLNWVKEKEQKTKSVEIYYEGIGTEIEYGQNEDNENFKKQGQKDQNKN
jgi:hypothetical protein